MNILSRLVSRQSQRRSGRTARDRQQQRRNRPRVEQLEDRLVPAPTVLDPNLEVRTVVAGLTQPTSMAFLRTDTASDFLLLEKNSGQVFRVVQGFRRPVLDLAVNNGGERGLLGIALHPSFHDDDPKTPRYVYLYWTESTAVDAAGNPVDSGAANNTPLLGNRVDRFIWNGSTLKQDANIIRLRALQPPNAPFETGNFTNHNGGVIRFGPDGKLYIFIGDNGRRGFMQNVLVGHAQNGMDDQFGGPEPDDAHLTGVTLRLNDDGTAPEDNPFFAVGAQIGEIAPEAGANLQKVFAYGHRNSFGMAFDPFTGLLWNEENGDNSFTELNLVLPGMNGGWIQVAGPLSRVAEFRAIETGQLDPALRGLQQLRFSPDELPSTPDEALTNLFQLEGSHYSDPEFSWKFEVAPAGIGFLSSAALGKQYAGDLFVGAARVFLAGGQIWRFRLNADRTGFVFNDPRLEDLVADNRFTGGGRFDITESESLLFGINFGIATDIQTGPNGNLFVVSLSDGAVYEIRQRATPPVGTFFTAIQTGDQEVPARSTAGLAIALFTLDQDLTRLSYTVYIFGLDLTGSQTPDPQDNIGGLHIHRGPAGGNGPIVFGMIGPDTDLDGPFISTEPGVVGGTVTGDWDLDEGNAGATLASELGNLLAEGLYINLHTTRFPGGEVRGQILPNASKTRG